MKANTMRQLRRFHFYVGVFFAPAILFFALSGALQTFRWNEAKGYGGSPPGWIVWMASVHKDQSLPRPKSAHGGPAGEGQGPMLGTAARNAPEDAGGPQGAKGAKGGPRPETLPLRIFVGLLGVGLLLSALLGVAVALGNRATRRLSLAMLAAGTILPLALLLG